MRLSPFLVLSPLVFIYILGFVFHSFHLQSLLFRRVIIVVAIIISMAMATVSYIFTICNVVDSTGNKLNSFYSHCS